MDEVNECHNSPDLIANQCKQFVCVARDATRDTNDAADHGHTDQSARVVNLDWDWI